MRFYDRLLECKAKNEPYDENIKHWSRMEFEFKDIRAMSVCDSLISLSPEEFGSYISQVTNHYIRFIVPKGTRSNYYRCSSRKWWKNVVGTIEKAKLVENKAYRNRFNSTMRWLKKQVFPTLYAVLHCVKVDELITDIRDCGVDRMSNKGKGSNFDLIINDYLKDTQSEVFKGIEIHKASCDDFKDILAEFDKVAFSTKMRYKALKLCEVLKLDDAKKILVEAHRERIVEEYRRMHKPHGEVVEGMFDKNITNFMNEQQLLNDYPFASCY